MVKTPAPTAPLDSKIDVKVESKLNRGYFRCFHCQSVFKQKDGNWHSWKNALQSLEVHLCKPCNLITRDRPERRK